MVGRCEVRGISEMMALVIPSCRTCDCMDAGGRATHGAVAESGIHGFIGMDSSIRWNDEVSAVQFPLETAPKRLFQNGNSAKFVFYFAPVFKQLMRKQAVSAGALSWFFLIRPIHGPHPSGGRPFNLAFLPNCGHSKKNKKLFMMDSGLRRNDEVEL